MTMTQTLDAKKGDVLLMVGTRKGAFLLSSDTSRKNWSVSGPHHAGTDIYHLAYDPRDGTVFAAINSPIWGPEIQRSTDLGGDWQKASSNPKFATDKHDSLDKVWHVERRS